MYFSIFPSPFLQNSIYTNDINLFNNYIIILIFVNKLEPFLLIN
ncbi:hypothetical protein CLL_A2493 [Clostridium botulinum B str. Eklund 17B (NRP)]|uniref:Uncharacterized protein n=1 Tax=Clostridium botulinum (strain Eklund 17B / Type B) TaxID=935198 RepID=B2TS75_CLOBB|nr:hypothetical protein CLL_A2493 [Clostridium botulinum B str. Eklund 17B (NRP)]